MERLQIMGDQRRVEVNGVIDVQYFRNPPFKADDPLATLADGIDTLSWKPNFTAAANEDFKGYNALLGAFFADLDGHATDLPTIDDGVRRHAGSRSDGRRLSPARGDGQGRGFSGGSRAVGRSRVAHKSSVRARFLAR